MNEKKKKISKNRGSVFAVLIPFGVRCLFCYKLTISLNSNAMLCVYVCARNVHSRKIV